MLTRVYRRVLLHALRLLPSKVPMPPLHRDDEPEDAAGGGAQQGAPKKAKGAAASAAAPLIYPKPEDDAYHKHAAWSFLFPASVAESTAAADRTSKLTQMRLVMCVEASKTKQVLRDTQRIVDALAAAPVKA